jgi:hypothetical protein
VKAEKRLWLNADRSKVVEDGDPDARFLLAAPGQEVHPSIAEKYGLKQKKAPANKKKKAPANKQKKTDEKKDEDR